MTDKVVLISNASAEIGTAAAELFAGSGARVALAGRSVSTIRKIAADIPNSFAIPVDLSNPDDMYRMVYETYRHYGRLDVLINDAGQGFHVPRWGGISSDDLESLMLLRLYGPMVAMQTAIPIMKKQGGGSIITVNSEVSKSMLLAISAYMATDWTFDMFSLTARKNLAEDGIMLYEVSAGPTIMDLYNSLPAGNARPSPPRFAPPSADHFRAVAEEIFRSGGNGRETEPPPWTYNQAAN